MLSSRPHPGEHDIADARNPLGLFREHKALCHLHDAQLPSLAAFSWPKAKY